MRSNILNILSALTAAVLMCGSFTSCKSSRHTITGDSGVTGNNSSHSHRRPPQQSNYVNGITSVSDNAKGLIMEARKWLGTKYVYGGHSRSGTDCSGLVMEVYRSACGMKLPRTTVDQRAFCKEIERRHLAPGDLLFFTSKSSSKRISHVGLYIGKGEMIHASSSRGVIVSRIDEKYYVDNYHSAGRILKGVDNPVIEHDNRIPSPETNPQTVAPVVIASASPAVPSPAPTPTPDDILDDILTQTIDSIYSTPKNHVITE